MSNKKKIAILASGNGTNAQRIIEHFTQHPQIEVACVIYNRKTAKVAQRAQTLNIPAIYFNKKDFLETNKVVDYLQQNNIDYIILAGFLLLVPQNILELYPNKILNIHPSLLPKHGGFGMYGDIVHQEVIDQKEKESGITIHIVNEQYDRGDIVFQAKCEVLPQDTPDSLAQRIHQLEHKYFPEVIESFILKH